MCGIVAVIGGVPPGEVRAAALGVLAHRGPDASGELCWHLGDRPVWLGHRRLRVVDLSAEADQPMVSAHGQVAVVYNGELYDHADHRRRLGGLRTTTDTEVLLALYTEADGDVARFLGRLRGMFAFVLVDRARGRVVAARDRLGIKPLVWARGADGTLAFASEARALRALGHGARLDPRAVAGYLAFGVVPGPGTAFEGISTVPPGSAVVVDPGGVRELRWWEPRFGSATPPADEAARVVGERVDDAVARHLVADRPVGVFLSGGLDSTAVATVAARRGPVHALTVTFPDADDEGDVAAATARRIGARHRTVPVTGTDVAARLDDLLEAMDSPTHDGINTWLVSGAAAEAGLVVVLSGLGGDELFGGYPTFGAVPRLVRLAPGLRAVPAGVRRTAARAVAARRPGHRWARVLAAHPDARGLWEATRRLLSAVEVPADTGGQRVRAGGRAGRDGSARPRQRGRTSALEVVAAAELGRYMVDQLLRDTDQMSMAHSIEVRVPLLDGPLVEAVLGLDPRVRLAAGKALLARATGVDWHAPKRPFALPMDTWLRGPLADRLTEGLLSDTLPLGEVVPGSLRRRLAAAWDAGRVHWSRPWSVAVLRLWAAHHGVGV